jgi:hypothetical protein
MAVTQTATMPNVNSTAAGEPVSFAVQIRHSWKAPQGNVLRDYADQSLGTIISPDLILAHNHFSQPEGRLSDEAFSFEDSAGRSIRWRAIDLHLIPIDAGTMLIKLPAPAFPTSALVSDQAALEGLTANSWLAVDYWDDGTRRIARRDFQIVQINDGIAMLADPKLVINIGDSGGGVYFNGKLVGNTWSINLDDARHAIGSFNVALLPPQARDIALLPPQVRDFMR